MNNIHVYLHRRLDNNTIFYVGIGSKYRVYNKLNRSLFWKRIVNKVGFSIDILYNNLTWEEAAKIEKELILKYGRINIGTGILCNLTDGGEGTLGRVVSQETRLKISNSNIGRKVSKETIKNLSISHLGNTLTKESINKRTLTMIDSDKYKKGSSQFKGVSWCKKKRKWRATIHMNSKCIHIGYFSDETVAYEEYLKLLNIKKEQLLNKEL